MVKQGDKVWFKTKDGKLIQGVLKGKQVITGKKKYRPPLDNLHPTLETARKSVWRSKKYKKAEKPKEAPPPPKTKGVKILIKVKDYGRNVNKDELSSFKKLSHAEVFGAKAKKQPANIGTEYYFREVGKQSRPLLKDLSEGYPKDMEFFSFNSFSKKFGIMGERFLSHREVRKGRDLPVRQIDKPTPPPPEKTFTPHNTQAPNRVDLKKVNKPTPPPPTMDDFMDVMHVMGERGKQKNPEGRILELSMNREYSDWGLLNYLDENWEGIVNTDWDSIFRDWESYDEYGNEIWRKRFKTKKEANKEWNKIQDMELGMEYNLKIHKR
jgi:hypothetical protein